MFQNIIKVNYIALKSKFPPVLVPICQALTVSMNNIDQMFWFLMRHEVVVSGSFTELDNLQIFISWKLKEKNETPESIQTGYHLLMDRK